MVLGIITSIAACPAIIGTVEAVRQGQRQSAKERHRGAKTNLVVSASSSEIDGCPVELRDGRLYIATRADRSSGKSSKGHPFAGYFLPYPEQTWGRRGEGLVSTISDDPPQLNWIFVDDDTYEVRYGDRLASQGHIVGPWDCTSIDKRLTLEGWEGFVAVQEVEYLDEQDEKGRATEGWDENGERKSWVLWFDRDDDALATKIAGWKVVEVELIRKERRKRKDDEGA